MGICFGSKKKRIMLYLCSWFLASRKSSGEKDEKIMSIAVVTLKKGEGRMLKAGGLWIFDNEIERVEGPLDNGDIVTVQDLTDMVWGRDF